METRVGLWIALAAVLLLRLSFLNQPIQGDDGMYLTEAEHALIEPLHPANTQYIFRGKAVDLRGQSHPALNGWMLAGLLAALGEVKEVPFHGAYAVFSLIAVAAMWGLARRFSPQPLWATLLFLAVPAFVVNGNSLEADVPFLAFWMAAIALFCGRRLGWAVAAMALAAMTAYQAVFLAPILAVYVWLYRRRDFASWVAILTPPAALAGWQLFERWSTGALPAAVVSGYFVTYGFQALGAKLRSALALLVHSGFVLFPALLPGALLLAWRKRKEPETQFLLAWTGIFMAGAVIVFFAGSARYLLPIAAPLALFASRLPAKWLAAGFAAQMALSLGLAVVNYQHWDGYRSFARTLRPPEAARVWVDDQWGLRFYVEAGRGVPLEQAQRLRAGDVVVTSELSHAVEYTAPVTTIARMEIRPAIPLRLIGLESASGFSTSSRGLWPFGISTGTIDRVHADVVMDRHPGLQYVTLGRPEATEQIVSGIFPDDRWMSQSGVVVVKNPPAAEKLQVEFYIPPQAKARRVLLLLDGRDVAAGNYTRSGAYKLATPIAVRGSGESATVEIRVDRTFTAPGDQRELGLVLMGVGFAP